MEILWQLVNSVAWLEILWPAENRWPWLSTNYGHVGRAWLRSRDEPDGIFGIQLEPDFCRISDDISGRNRMVLNEW